jgi:hypothetical protein
MINEKIASFVKNINKPKLLFIWIPKNAGTSVYESLNDTIGMKKILEVSKAKSNFFNHGSVTFGHMDIGELRKHEIISQKYYRDSFKFCFTRNPYDRFLSLFHYFQIVNRIPPGYTYRTLIEEVKSGIEPVGLYNFKDLSQCNKQVEWIKNIELDRFYRFENLQDAFYDLSKVTNKNVQLIHENKSANNKDRRKALDQETVNMIQEFYEEDFLKFGYSFDINEE